MKQKISFSIPITESATEEQDGKTTFMIRGVAINEGTTRNGHIFVADELEKGAPSLRNKPILKDHWPSVDSVVGRTTDNVTWNAEKKAVMFEGIIVDPAMQEKISQKLINNVSVGAFVENPELIRNEEDEVVGVKMNGIEFVELSLVPVPADKNANFARACMEAAENPGSLVMRERPFFNITNDHVSGSGVDEGHQAEECEEEKRMAEEKNELRALREANEALEMELLTMKKEALLAEKNRLLAATKAAETADQEEDEKATEEDAEEKTKVEDKTVGGKDLGTENATNAYALERGDRGLCLTTDYSKMSGLKNLVRGDA